MDVRHINEHLLNGKANQPGVLPHLEELSQSKYVFATDFGLEQLPEIPGVLLIRGPRQYGKSTWLEQQIFNTIKKYGPGTAFYLNSDELRDADELIAEIRTVISLFKSAATIKRIFIDEITSIPNWERALKRLVDSGELRRVLVVTTGSKAADLRHGTERLPGRKGRLGRTSYLFTPISYKEFKRVCGERLKERTLSSYLLSGGSPIACSELGSNDRLPEFVTQMINDWVLGEFAVTGRSRSSLLGVLEVLHRYGATPVGQAKLAREAGLANNTVAQGYIDLLGDLMCVIPAYSWDSSKRTLLRRRPCKYHFVNLLCATTWHPKKPKTADDFESLTSAEQGLYYEWLVAQEIWRRACIRGVEIPDSLAFWESKEHEVDFVQSPSDFIEVKRGHASPLQYDWFVKSHPKAKLVVINQARFETSSIRGITMEDFLLEDA
ncbi:MAG: ATP-binding protein [Deltaproteobacteria bacterium]|nr:ATP-binding protein [Deltaproteobacteria bacterium]